VHISRRQLCITAQSGSASRVYVAPRRPTTCAGIGKLNLVHRRTYPRPIIVPTPPPSTSISVLSFGRPRRGGDVAVGDVVGQGLAGDGGGIAVGVVADGAHRRVGGRHQAVGGVIAGGHRCPPVHHGGRAVGVPAGGGEGAAAPGIVEAVGGGVGPPGGGGET